MRGGGECDRRKMAINSFRLLAISFLGYMLSHLLVSSLAPRDPPLQHTDLTLIYAAQEVHPADSLAKGYSPSPFSIPDP